MVQIRSRQKSTNESGPGIAAMVQPQPPAPRIRVRGRNVEAEEVKDPEDGKGGEAAEAAPGRKARVKPRPAPLEGYTTAPRRGPEEADESASVKPVARADVTKAPAAWLRVHRAQYSGRQLQGEQYEEEVIAVPAFHSPVGYVNVDGGITKNMGDYNSVRVRVSISLPCYPEDTEIRRAYQHASTLIDELLPAELDKACGVDPQ